MLLVFLHLRKVRISPKPLKDTCAARRTVGWTALSFRRFKNVAELPCGPRLLMSAAVTRLCPRGLALLREGLLFAQFCDVVSAHGLLSLSYLELLEFVGLCLPSLESFSHYFFKYILCVALSRHLGDSSTTLWFPCLGPTPGPRQTRWSWGSTQLWDLWQTRFLLFN